MVEKCVTVDAMDRPVMSVPVIDPGADLADVDGDEERAADKPHKRAWWKFWQRRIDRD